MPAAHTVVLDDWKPYEDLTSYEKEDSGYLPSGVNTGIEVMGAMWLMSEDRRRGKEASSLVIYTKSTEEIAAMRLGGKRFPTGKYDWNRGHPRQRDTRYTRSEGLDDCTPQ